MLARYVAIVWMMRVNILNEVILQGKTNERSMHEGMETVITSKAHQVRHASSGSMKQSKMKQKGRLATPSVPVRSPITVLTRPEPA